MFEKQTPKIPDSPVLLTKISSTQERHRATWMLVSCEYYLKNKLCKENTFALLKIIRVINYTPSVQVYLL